MEELENSGKGFFYGTLASPSIANRYPVEHLGEAVLYGLGKHGNNLVEPALSHGSDTVRGHLFEVDDFTNIDGFEESHGYQRYPARTEDDETVFFYALPSDGVEELVEEGSIVVELS